MQKILKTLNTEARSKKVRALQNLGFPNIRQDQNWNFGTAMGLHKVVLPLDEPELVKDSFLLLYQLQGKRTQFYSAEEMCSSYFALWTKLCTSHDLTKDCSVQLPDRKPPCLRFASEYAQVELHCKHSKHQYERSRKLRQSLGI